jgi:transposase InsO family protein
VRVFAFVLRQKADFAVKTLCQVCQVSASGFYDWAARQGAGPSASQAAEADLVERIRLVHAESRGRYGEPRVTEQLARDGVVVNHKRVERLMAREGLQGRCGRRKMRTTIADPTKAPAADLVNRQFNRDELDQLWVGDATYIPTDEGWLFLATVIDACSRRLLGWSITDHLRTELCLDALDSAVATRGGKTQVAGVIFHSDHGTQYTSDAFGAACARSGITQSMGTVGDSYDKGIVSYCTSWCGLGQNSLFEVASLPFCEAGVAGGGRVEEPGVAVVGSVAGEQAGSMPGLDGGGAYAESVGDLGDGEFAGGVQSVVPAGELMVAT